MTETQRTAMQAALYALVKSIEFCNHIGTGDWQPTVMACHRARDALTAALAEPVQEPVDIDQIAADRYKVVPSHDSMFHRWAVVAGDGAQQLYLGRDVECQNMARKLAGAFLDGAYLAAQQPAPVQAHKTTGWVAPKNHYAVPVLFNPYTGEPRDVRDVQSDPQGVMIIPPGKVEVLAAQHPAPVQEPDAFLHDDGCWTAAKTDAGRTLNDRLNFAGSPKVAVYTAPQAQPAPVQEPVGVVESAVAGCGGFHAKLIGNVMPKAGAKLYTSPQAQQPRKAVKLSDTVTRLMELADSYANSFNQFVPQAEQCRQALQDELTRLFTPLSDEQISDLISNTSKTGPVRVNGITGDSK